MVFNKREIVESNRFLHDYEKGFISLSKKYTFEQVCVCSVRKMDEKLTQAMSIFDSYLNLSHQTNIPIENRYNTPETLGKDRIAAVVGAYSKYPNQSSLVIDLGTCITYDFITSDGVYLGGNIAPGVDMRLKAMHHFTSKLPSVDKESSDNVMGLTTEEALNLGSVRGIIFEIEGYSRYLSALYDDINVILTGGNAIFFGELVESKIFVDQNLVLEGLNEIILYNS